MTVKAWHFTAETLRDGRPVPAIGETLTHEGEIKWCRSGLYASRDVFDALSHARGPYLHRVNCDRIEREDDEKFVCRERTIVASIDAAGLLRSFARQCALDVIHLWDAPEVVREYLTTGDESLRAAAGADAWAAWADARAARAAWAAAGADVRAALAAWAAARDAARAAGAAGDAAGADARAAQRKRFNKMVDAAFRESTK